MRRSILKFWIAAFAGLGLTGLAGSAFPQTTGVPGGTPGTATATSQGGAPSPGAQSGIPGGNPNGVGGNLQGNGEAALTQGTPGGMPTTSGPGTTGPAFRDGTATGGNVGSYGRFVQPAGGSPGMFGNSPGGNSPGMFTNSNGMFGGQPSLFGMNRVGNSPVGTPGGNSQNGGVFAPYGTPGGNGVYAGNTSGLYTSPGGLGPAGTNYGGGYANNDIGYRGYSEYYGNNSGVGLNSSGINSMGLNSAGLNSGLNGNYTSNYYGNAPQYYGQGMQAGSVPTGPGVGNLGYPNAITAGSYPGNNAGVNSWPANAGPSGNYAPTYYGSPYVPPNYNYYGTGAAYAPSGPGVGNLGYPNPVTPGAYPSGSSPWF